MRKSIRFAYDRRSDQYIIMESVSEKSTGAETIAMPLQEVDRQLDNAIRQLAKAIERSHMFEMEQMKFLYMHMEDKNVVPELSRFNEEYLKSLDKIIKEAKEHENEEKQGVVDALKNAKYISVDPLSIFLFSFLSGNNKSVMKRIIYDTVNDWGAENVSFDKEKYIVDNLNILNFNEKNVKIFLTEKDNREMVKIVADRDTWDNIGHNQEYQKMLTDQFTRTTLYSLSSEKYKEIEKGLKASTSAKNYLDEKLGGPVAIKHRGEKAECMKILGKTLNSDKK